MNINKSKVTLAAKIKSSGFEWPQLGKWATQDKDGEIFISGGDFTPVRMSGEVNWGFDAPYKSAGKVEVGLNWFQCILSRAEYFHLYPAPDADGWIEWNGGECPVGEGDLIDVKFSDGDEFFDVGSDWSWDVDAGSCNIIAYRLHKPGQAVPEFCESVMRSIPEPDEQVWTNPPTIEQLASDYRSAKDYADRKQQEADDAKADADSKLKALELAGEALGLLVSPITAKQEPELVIANRSQLELGDVIWLSDSTVKENNELTPSGEYTVVKVGVIGVESDGQTIYPDFSTREWRFIRRP